MGMLDKLLNLVVWNSNYEDEPAGGDSPSFGDDAIREDKQGVRERFEKEHKMDLLSGVAASDGWHKRGSAISYYQVATPTTRPDGTTALTDDDAGRLWHRTTTGVLYIYKGTTLGWVSSATKAFVFSLVGNLYVASGILPPLVLPTAFTITSVTSKLEIAPTGADDVRFDLKKNGSDSIFTAGYVELEDTSSNVESDLTEHAVLSSGDYLTFDVTQIGTTIGGSTLTIAVYGSI